ncbi:MAG: YggS family pyridoxal phosphate-dependent enzyme [Corynebacterium sp.]|uniref:YggS family pyridoxal phosphate-dependent enzyme n=1 Tax=Corynebacterium sp. TaxID=1720 RepID=UPI0026DD352E|nr:YggS family pyridoxal phosphate-dependent enzyme [Corynebacterium sp.]MDO4762497.1 YggS family pyridoxal phosphate-dependent enzyme [Corynebacterium sp.]
MSINAPQHPHTVADFQANVTAVRERIAAAASTAGRDPDDIRLIPVSKSFPVEVVKVAVEAGLTTLGENRPLEMAEKAQLIDGVTWCMLGPVQRNKAREVALWATELHSLDSVRLCEALQRRLEAADRRLDVFIQVNTSQEDHKGGLGVDQVEEFATQLVQFPRLRPRGLMTLAAYSPEEKVVRAAFSQLYQLRERLRPLLPETVKLEELSMGMSSDFEWAIAEGATTVRVGTAIFGHRAQSVYLQ